MNRLLSYLASRHLERVIIPQDLVWDATDFNELDSKDIQEQIHLAHERTIFSRFLPNSNHWVAKLVKSFDDIKPGEHLSVQRPYIIRHHMIVTAVCAKLQYFQVVEFTGNSKNDAKVKRSVYKFTPGLLFRYVYFIRQFCRADTVETAESYARMNHGNIKYNILVNNCETVARSCKVGRRHGYGYQMHLFARIPFFFCCLWIIKSAIWEQIESKSYLALFGFSDLYFTTYIVVAHLIWVLIAIKYHKVAFCLNIVGFILIIATQNASHWDALPSLFDGPLICHIVISLHFNNAYKFLRNFHADGYVIPEISINWPESLYLAAMVFLVSSKLSRSDFFFGEFHLGICMSIFYFTLNIPKFTKAHTQTRNKNIYSSIIDADYFSAVIDFIAKKELGIDCYGTPRGHESKSMLPESFLI